MDAALPVALTKEQLECNAAASRLECRLALETALEARFPRLACKKPVFNSAPLDLYLLHQAVLRHGGYRKVRGRGGVRVVLALPADRCPANHTQTHPPHTPHP